MARLEDEGHRFLAALSQRDGKAVHRVFHFALAGVVRGKDPLGRGAPPSLYGVAAQVERNHLCRGWQTFAARRVWTGELPLSRFIRQARLQSYSLCPILEPPIRRDALPEISLGRRASIPVNAFAQCHAAGHAEARP